MKAKTQDDLVVQDQGYVQTEEVRKVRLPGIENLHTKPIAEIAECLANVLRMEQNIVKISYTIGEFIEITTQKK